MEILQREQEIDSFLYPQRVADDHVCRSSTKPDDVIHL